MLLFTALRNRKKKWFYVKAEHLAEIMTITRSGKTTDEQIAALKVISKTYDHKNPELFHYMAWVYFEARDYLPAMAYLSTAIAIDPDNPTYLRLHLVLLDHTGLNDAEQELFRIYSEKFKSITGSLPDRDYRIPKNEA